MGKDQNLLTVPDFDNKQRKESILIDAKSNIVIHQSESAYIPQEQQKPQQTMIFGKSRLFTQISIGSKEDIARDLLNSLIKVTDNNGLKLQYKYDIEYIRQVLQRDLIQFEIAYTKFVQTHGQTVKGVNLVDFIFIIIQLIDIPSHETVFLIIAIIDFFEAVTQVEKTDSRKFFVDEKMFTQIKNFIKLSDITLFLCENHPFNEQTLPQNIKIPTKSIPLPKIFDNSTTERIIRDIDITAPVIYRDSNETLQRLNKDKIHIDSVHHNNNMISKSLYAKEINKLIVLDQYSDIFIVYDNDCKMQQKFRPTSQHLRGQVCIDFIWSEKQMRVGSVFRDNFLAFWDSNDNFSFEKSFNVGESILEEQSKIWYLNCIDRWITSDNYKSINIWNLEKEEVTSQIKSELFSKGIISILEVDYLKIVAIGSSDNIISVWDFMGQKLLFKITVSHTHLNSMCYFQTYQVILTGGYDNQICIYQFHPTYNDANKMGELHGHMSIITAFKGVEGTPMVVSCDDKYNVKIWDIRSTICVQSIDVDLRNPIKQIHTTLDRVFFQSSRVTSVEFDIDVQQKIDIKNKFRAASQLQGESDGYQPIGSALNIKRKELIACTTKDVRFFDISNGKIKKIISSLSENKEDSITSFQILDQFQKILIGTLKGNLRIHDLKTGELLSDINAHSNEITGLRMDHQNKLLLSTSSDSSILIQKINPKLQSHKYREVLNSHYGQEILLVEVSVYHNIFVTASQDNVLLIWSYEFGKLMASFELEADQEPTAISIINGYSIIIVATSKGYIYFIRFTYVDDNLDLEIIANINIIKSLILRGEGLKKLVASEVKRAYQLQENEARKLKNEKKKLKIQEEKLKNKQQKKGLDFTLPLSTEKTEKSNGSKTQLNLSSVMDNNSKKTMKLLDQKKNNISKDLENVGKKKIDITSLYNENEVRIEGDDKDLFDLDIAKSIPKKDPMNTSSSKKESNIYANKLIFDLCLDQDNKIDFESNNFSQNSTILPESCTLIVGINNGEIRKYDISTIFKKPKIKLVQHCKTKMNYNAFRQNFENYTNTMSNHKIQCFKQSKNNILKDIIVLNNLNRTKAISKFQVSVMKLSQVRGLILKQDDSDRPFDNYFNQSKNMVDLVQGHKSHLINLEFMKIHSAQNEMIISCGQDNYIKIWNFFGKISLVAAVNILHPLPIKWEFKVDYDLIYQNKILLAIKSLEAVHEKYNSEMDFSKYQKFNIRNLLNFIEQREKQMQIEEIEKLQELNSSQKNISPSRKSQHLEKEQIQYKNMSLSFMKENLSEDYDENKKIKLMKDEYTPKDLLFEKIKHLYQKELTGTSLKQLQEMKRIENSKNQNSIPYKYQKQDEYQHYLNQEEKNKEIKYFTTFFHPDYRKKMLEKFQNDVYYLDRPNEIHKLEKKLDQLLLQKSISEHQMQMYQTFSQLRSSNQSQNQQNQNQQHNQSRQPSNHQSIELKEKQHSQQSRSRGSQINELQGIFMTQSPHQNNPTINYNNLSDQVLSNNKNISNSNEKSKQSPIIIVSEVQSIRNSKRGSILNVPNSLMGTHQQFDQNQKSINKIDNNYQLQTENSAGHSNTANNFLQVQSNQDKNVSQHLYFPQKPSHSVHQSVESLKMIKSVSHDRGQKLVNITPFDKSISQNQIETDTTNIVLQQTNNMNKIKGNKHGNSNILRDEFSLKKEAKEIYNFNKKIPQSTTDTFSTGGEYLIQINKLERNHGMKFKLFENTIQPHKQFSQTARNSQSPKEQKYQSSKRLATLSNQKSTTNNGFNTQTDPFYQNSSKEFLEYAQEKSLMNQQLQESYNKQQNKITTSQVKSYFLNQIENESDRKKFNDKFEQTVIPNQINQFPQSIVSQVGNAQEQQLNLNGNKQKPHIPNLNLSSNLNNNNNLFHSNSKIDIKNKKSNNLQQSLTQRTIGNDIDSTQDSSFPINSQKQQFSKTSRKCFQDVVKNLNSKLSKSRINHHKGGESYMSYSLQKTNNDIENDSTQKQDSPYTNFDDFSKPFLTHRQQKTSQDDSFRNSYSSQLKPNKQTPKQQVTFK